MKGKFIYIKYAILALIFTVFGERLSAQVMPDKAFADSLKEVLHHTPLDKDKISVLKKLVNLYWQLPEEVTYLQDIIEISERVDSLNILFSSFTGVCRYYYNEGKDDSLFHWKEKLDSLASARQTYPAAYFRAGNIIAMKYLEEANYELAMNEAMKLLSKAEREARDDRAFGMMCSNLNLGLIYQAVRRDSDAVVAFQNGLKWWSSDQIRPSLLLQYLSDMIISTLRVDNFEESKTLLKRYKEVFTSEINKCDSLGIVFPMQWHRWLIETYYVELYVRKGNLNKAGEHLAKATKYIETESDEEMKFRYYQAAAMYYQKKKKYSQAMGFINKALKIKEDLSLMKMKVDLLRGSGQTEEALALYDKLLRKNSEVGNTAFVRQMKQLRLLNNLNDEKKKANELAYQSEQIQIKQRLIIFTSLISLILLIILFYLNRYFRRTWRLKNELQSERNMLVESERQLQATKAAAEKANQDKTAFIASISHEVRTPLNAIVGFSELLAEDVYEEEDKKGFATIINDSSGTLMNLINDVLDLSRLESDNARLIIEPCDCVACSLELVREMAGRAANGVKLTFTSSLESCEIETDVLRLRQLLSKLLLNALKFTTSGEINLTCQVDQEKQEVRFIVTDTGCGIPLEKHEMVFERFEKLDDFVQGTGLGLPIGRMIAQKLGGSLRIDPDYTEGARFIFIHPLKNNQQYEKE